MLVVGLTGGIGSGKSAVSNGFQQLGVPVIDADVIAHQLTQKGATAFQSIIEHFGNGLLTAKGTLDRAHLKKIIFTHANERRWLENLLHPLIRQQIRHNIATLKEHPYCIVVIPLLLESPGIDFIDRILVVDVPEHVQVKRVTQRDAINESIITSIMKAQTPREDRLKLAHDVISNVGTLDDLKSEIANLHLKYSKLGTKRPA